MRLAGVVTREEVLLRVVREARAWRSCVRAIACVAIEVCAIGESSVSLPVGNVGIRRLRLFACACARQFRITQHREA
eukprot:1247460-Pleurochrysis_carterae.AAC.1